MRDFPHLSRPALGPTQPLVNRYGAFPGGKERPGRDADPSPPYSAVVKKQYSYTSTPPLGAVGLVQSLSACTRVHFTLLFTHRTYLCDVSVVFVSTPRCSKQSLQVFPPKPCMCCSSLPCVPHVPPISPSLIGSRLPGCTVHIIQFHSACYYFPCPTSS
jgi:hypothetical protein